MVSLLMTLSDPWPGFQGHGSFRRRISRERCILETKLLDSKTDKQSNISCTRFIEATHREDFPQIFSALSHSNSLQKCWWLWVRRPVTHCAAIRLYQPGWRHNLHLIRAVERNYFIHLCICSTSIQESCAIARKLCYAAVNFKYGVLHIT